MRRVAMVLLLVGCGPAVRVDADTSSTGEASTSTSFTTTLEPTTSSTTSGTSTSTTSTSTVGEVTTASADESSEGHLFIMVPDGGPCFTHCVDIQCDLWSQDCPDGSKCAPWADDGGDQWNASECIDLDPTPAQPGEPCTIAGAPASGDDDCDISALCWDVDPGTGLGTCVPFCGGSEANPMCEGDTSCWIANDGVLILCLPTCDPLAPTCGDGSSCVANGDAFFCLPSERVAQAYDAACEEWLGCGTGLVCAGAGSTPNCDASCCTALCDLATPMCPDQDAGQSCVPYFAAGTEPPGLENVGVCLVE
ncbi:MAG: hypothetical protein JNK45_27545 [Myxococcales bacterium]|nr:hypothetical protein [Myxococcales bacterium]